MGWLLLIVALAPVLFMLHYVYVRDKYEREPLGLIVRVFLVSLISILPAALIEGIFSNALGEGWIALAIQTFIVIALTEECMKYLFLRWIILRHKAFNEVYDGILYGVTVALGFAAAENLLYVFATDGGGLATAILRAVLAVPGHALWGVIIGYHVGLARFSPGPKARVLVIAGVAQAAFWHGLYDFLALGAGSAPESVGLLMVLGLPLVIAINWVIAVRYVGKAQARSLFKLPAPIVNPLAAVTRWQHYCHHCGKRIPPGAGYCSQCGSALGAPAGADAP